MFVCMKDDISEEFCYHSLKCIAAGIKSKHEEQVGIHIWCGFWVEIFWVVTPCSAVVGYMEDLAVVSQPRRPRLLHCYENISRTWCGLVRILLCCFLHAIWSVTWPCSHVNVTDKMLCHAINTKWAWNEDWDLRLKNLFVDFVTDVSLCWNLISYTAFNTYLMSLNEKIRHLSFFITLTATNYFGRIHFFSVFGSQSVFLVIYSSPCHCQRLSPPSTHLLCSVISQISPI